MASQVLFEEDKNLKFKEDSMSTIVLTNGKECTNEFYTDFCNIFQITPNEFLEMNKTEIKSGLYVAKIQEDDTIKVVREEG